MKWIKHGLWIIIFILIVINLALIHLAYLPLYLFLVMSLPAFELLYLRIKGVIKPSPLIHGIIVSVPLIAAILAVTLTQVIL